MALLKDTVVSGSLRATDSLLTTTAQTQILKLPTASNGTTYGPGTSGHIVYSNGTSVYWGATTGITSLGTVTTGTWSATTINPNKGGTGVNSYAKGDILYAGAAIANTATTALSKLTIGSSGQVLQTTSSGIPGWITATNANTASTIVKRDGSGNFSAGTITATLSGNASTSTKWAAAQTVYVALGTASTTTSIQGGNSSAVTLGVNGTLGIGNGGTGKTSWTQWGIVYASATNTLAQVAAGSSSNSGYVLQSNGAAAPGWIQATNAKTASTIMKRDSNGGFDAVFSTIDSKFKIQYNGSTNSLEFVYIS